MRTMKTIAIWNITKQDTVSKTRCDPSYPGHLRFDMIILDVCRDV